MKVNVNINIEIDQDEEGPEEREDTADKKDEQEKEGVSSEPVADQTKPNVFFIMIDDMGFNDIGYQSNDLQGVTPNLDKLAAGGIKVTGNRTDEI